MLAPTDHPRRRANYSAIAIFNIAAICLSLSAIIIIGVRWNSIDNSNTGTLVSEGYQIGIIALLAVIFVLSIATLVSLVSITPTRKGKHWIHGAFILCLILAIVAAALATYTVVQYSQSGGVSVSYNSYTAVTVIEWILVVVFIILICITTFLY